MVVKGKSSYFKNRNFNFINLKITKIRIEIKWKNYY